MVISGGSGTESLPFSAWCLALLPGGSQDQWLEVWFWTVKFAFEKQTCGKTVSCLLELGSPSSVGRTPDVKKHQNTENKRHG